MTFILTGQMMPANGQKVKASDLAWEVSAVAGLVAPPMRLAAEDLLASSSRTNGLRLQPAAYLRSLNQP
jgi:hypothetical protein